ncbi:MAG: SIS domain-containing protein [Chloroflexi bacterium]|nr:MAG: SIS domain-containing protein [Chloroflexota bacterium]MBL1192786.1 SIS domain-containing protein [Chloroflexota bacterium]NOH10080.1 SIS domain-containing protein [Chloroflexota bacterium]
MEPMKPEVMVRQVNDIPVLNSEQTKHFDENVIGALSAEEMKSIKRVYITGDGDSYHAARAQEMFFENIAGIPCEPMSAQRFLDYGAEWTKLGNGNVLVVAISASGRTKRGLQSMARAKEFGALTLALTGTKGSDFTETGERVVVVDLPDFGRSPGIRTYNASLMGLALLALRLGEAHGKYDSAYVDQMHEEIIGLSSMMQATLEAVEAPAKEASVAWQDAPMEAWLGSGPSYGTALFSAAKVVEAAGVFAIGQDLEEWAHVERFAYPDDMPVVIIAPPGRSHWRAVLLADQVKKLGHRVGAVIQDGDDEIGKHADFIFPVMGEVREELSPLVYHFPSNFFAAQMAENLDRMLFQTNRTDHSW